MVCFRSGRDDCQAITMLRQNVLLFHKLKNKIEQRLR